jgi:hypothetical protein
MPNDNDYYIDKNLNTDTNYYYRLDSAKEIVRKPAAGDDSLLSVSDIEVIKESVITAKDKVQLTLFWKTNRGSSSQIEYGESPYYGQKTDEDKSLNMGHNITLAD